jgi:AcrR family transcriptional regulator
MIGEGRVPNSPEGSTTEAVDSPGDGETSVMPTTQRGRRTRERLLAAGTIIFQRDGYLDAKITDITQTAGVSSGTFYTYFRSKAEILAALIDELNQRMLAASAIPNRGLLDETQRIEAVTRAYVRAYRENASMIGILEQVATFDSDFREMRRSVRYAYRNRTERSLCRMRDQGLIDLATDPKCTAEALSSMVSNFCYVSYVLGENYDEEDSIATLTTLWLRGIGIRKVDSDGG